MRTQGHQRFELLLPWYVCGHLGVEETEELRGHLRTCSICAREYQRLLRLREAFADLRTATPPPPPAVLDRVWSKLLRHEREQAARSGWLARVALASAALLSAAAVGIVLRSAPYHTLGASPHSEVGIVQVVFDPHATEEQIRSLLQEVGATITAGPRPSGLYEIRVRPGTDPSAVVKRLRKDRLVRFVELAR